MNKDKLLTKSLYLNGLQCKKSLWLNKYNSEELKELDDATKERKRVIKMKLTG